jgi:malate dehydrogenase
MKIVILGATGSCGRQVAAQLLDRGVLWERSTMYLIGHEGGRHMTELWGLRADLLDAFNDTAPAIEVGTDCGVTDADIVVMMAGATVSRENPDRAALAETNRRIFTETAEAVGRMRSDVTVVVQSNPVELATEIFARHVPRHRVLAAAAWSDSLRFRRELAADLDLRRPMVQADMWGQHGTHLVPVWSQVRARGVSEQYLADVIGGIREGRQLSDFPHEIEEARAHVLDLVGRHEVKAAFDYLQARPADIRAAVKPFFTHFTAGRTTELATAHAVVDVVAGYAHGHRTSLPAQVRLEGDWLGINGVLAVPVVTELHGWSRVVPVDIPDDEEAALRAAADAVAAAM